jgi:predicted Zn finger-like uncharacterized protein
MRLICPNCGAQYEVDSGVVPDVGRDVQCSNCGHTWFQKPQNQDDDISEELGTPALGDVASQAASETGAVAATDPQDDPAEPGFTSSDDANVDGDAHVDGDDQGKEPDNFQPPPRTELNPDLAGILREEAERETVERNAETVGLETQTELGLGEGDRERTAAKERMARLRGLADDDLGAASRLSVPRKDLLPDIDEINSTLESSADREDAETTEDRLRRRQNNGFRRGFALTLLLFAALALIYGFAPEIVARLPGAEPFLEVYVGWVNALRSGVDGLMRAAAERLSELLSQLTGADDG